jgi:mRNA interferase RelE/StbE
MVAMLRIRFTPDALLALAKHSNRAAMIRKKVAAYAANPQSQRNNVKRMIGTNRTRFRLRVGDFRVIFEVEDDVMSIIMIGPRGEIYD